MARRRNRSLVQQRRCKSRRNVRLKPPTIGYLLEQGNLQDIQSAKKLTADFLKYSWDYYSELALQRSQIQQKITEVLTQACISNYKFAKWQRAVKWKYSLHPLSTVGSLTYIGGRFNTGSSVNSEVPTFPALYLACDKDTAMQETLGQIEVKNCKLSARELALTNPQSEAIVSVSGELEKIFDLRSADNLNSFVELIKGFKLSAGLKASAKSLGLPPPEQITKPKLLLESLLTNEWRKEPSIGDVPANPQIFGHLIYQAGIEGILYPSNLTGRNCLAIFPRNFPASSSHIVLDDESPHEKVPKRIDSTNWRICDLSPKELISS